MIDFKELPSDGIKFEQMVRELLIRSGFETHWTGVGPDLGRDLIVIEKSDGRIASFQRKWLVSCKHYAQSGKSVGLDDIQNIIDECESVNAQGFLLVCSTQPSSSVVKRFEEIEEKGRLITRYWDCVEIEKRLNTPSTFPIINIFLPISSKGNEWRIFNTSSPSFWAANYKDYFLYMSSRTANTFPELKDVETIVEKLESIKLPKDDDYQGHFLRIRAVFFDNKHDQYSVFADYLYPHGRQDEVIRPKQLDEYLQDGQGLYHDEKYMWKLTFWDIRYIECYQVSDHFHPDHKDYYDNYMRNFQFGINRTGYISEIDFD